MPILQRESEFEEVLDLYRRLQPATVLEIGTYHGGTLYHWLQNASEGTHVVSVDSYMTGVDNRHLYGSWCPEGVSVTAIEGDSRESGVIGQVAEHSPYDWIFIDGGHEYVEVRADWVVYRPLLRKKGGVVCFHDIVAHITHPEIQVHRLWNEIKAKGYRAVEVIEDPDEEWGGIGVVSF